MTYEHIIRAACESPWAIDERKLAEIQMFLELKASGGQVSPAAVAELTAAAASSRRTGKVAIIPIHGTIMPKANLMGAFSGGASLQRLSAELRTAVNDADVTTIVLDVDSPGGNTMGVTEFADQLMAARENKRVIAVANHTMASAAYWICAGATEIVASPSADVGSIGVIAMHVDRSGMMEMNGVKPTMIRAGRFKGELSEVFPLSEDAQAFIQARVDEMYDSFVGNVAKGRGVSASDVRKGFGEGRSISAREAKRAGMVDRIETLESVLSRLGVDSSSTDRRAEEHLPVRNAENDDVQPDEIASDAENTALASEDPGPETPSEISVDVVAGEPDANQQDASQRVNSRRRRLALLRA